ncbi:hypothetical protein CO724_03150 [Ectopseudomonas mendocina]|uniref:Uncharacterized protein n=2 Tax=Pseudomonadaceae TaxID=135621 RepID=A4Y0A5_ECTM1|nr:hypothetical protein PSMEN_22205 [Pseudomonas mendocina]ATH80212.1 hypothetical protein CO724_03150 [Pseudomonas mendocina]
MSAFLESAADPRRWQVRMFIYALTAIVASSAAGVGAVERIPVNIKSVERNHYQTIEESMHIHTRYCDEIAYADSALLVFEPYGLENKLVFRSGVTCEVTQVYDRDAYYTRTGR